MSTASDRLQLYLNAEAAILSGQEVRLDGRSRRMPDLPWVQEQINRLQRQVSAETRSANGGTGIRYQLPDFSQ